MIIPAEEALASLKKSGHQFLELFNHGSLSIEIYSPVKTDQQQPHDKDEVYIVISGNGEFYSDGKTVTFQKGDFLFVPAGMEHRFLNFTDDFSTWVVFMVKKEVSYESIYPPLVSHQDVISRSHYFIFFSLFFRAPLKTSHMIQTFDI